MPFSTLSFFSTNYWGYGNSCTYNLVFYYAFVFACLLNCAWYNNIKVYIIECGWCISTAYEVLIFSPLSRFRYLGISLFLHLYLKFLLKFEKKTRCFLLLYWITDILSQHMKIYQVWCVLIFNIKKKKKKMIISNYNNVFTQLKLSLK